MYSIPGEDAVKFVKMRTKDLEYCIKLIDKVTAGFERTDSNFERCPIVGKMLSNGITFYREITHERRSQLVQHTTLLSSFKKLSQ